MSSMPPPPPGYSTPPPQPPYGMPPSYPQPGPPMDASKKVAAGVCGILLGAFGVHKFILGMTKPGLIMLLITVLTCGVGGAVTSIIGLIEGIIYLTKSDHEFCQTYVVEKKEWF